MSRRKDRLIALCKYDELMRRKAEQERLKAERERREVARARSKATLQRELAARGETALQLAILNHAWRAALTQA